MRSSCERKYFTFSFFIIIAASLRCMVWWLRLNSRSPAIALTPSSAKFSRSTRAGKFAKYFCKRGWAAVKFRSPATIKSYEAASVNLSFYVAHPQFVYIGGLEQVVFVEKSRKFVAKFTLGQIFSLFRPLKLVDF